MTRSRYLLVGLLVGTILVMGLVLAVKGVPPSPTAAAPALPVGMKAGERYHAVHVDELKLKCDTCHVAAVETYYDPMAQVFNQADRRACLSCHSEGGAQPFYGENWRQAKVSR